LNSTNPTTVDTTNQINRRGKQKEPVLVHTNVRLPQYVVDHFISFPNYTQELRRVLTAYVDNKVGILPLENDDD